MAFEFRPAVRTKTSVLFALAGASGSGKTYTAILVAFGLAYPGMKGAEILRTIETEGRNRVAFIDTEGGRGKHYAAGPGQTPDFVSSFPFDYAEITAPYTPENYQEAVLAADAQGYGVIIVDSMSHEYESEGGIMEMADQIEHGVLKPGKTMADAEGSDGWKAWETKPVKSPGNWKEPKTRHKRMVNRMVQCRAHIIFCLRAEEKMLLRQVPQLNNDGSPKMWNGRPQVKTEVVPAADRPLLDRWQPICEKRFMYEMTVSFLLLPDAPGHAHPIKNLQSAFRSIFAPREGDEYPLLGVEHGRLMAEWSAGGGAAQQAGAKPRRTPEDMLAAYEAGLVKQETLGDLLGFQRAEATEAWVSKMRAEHPDIHTRIVAANEARYRELAGSELGNEGED